jgi:Leucine-rich repeat (LRR) protein
MTNSVFKNVEVTIYLTNNEITGTIPARLAQFERMQIDLVGNKIEKIPDELCVLDGWMQGNVKEVGNCNAILCPKGTFNQFGKESPGNPCLSCSHLGGVSFLGRSRCEDFTSERDTLNKLFDAAGGEFWNSSRSWKSEAPICSWGGVLCEDGDLQDTQGITSIKLESNGLSGTLPSDIWTLPSLRRVNVNDNPNLLVNFDGLANAADTLQIASFSNVKMSSLTGISAATSLRELHASGNNIQGKIGME